MTTYKISYVISDGSHPGGILNLDYEPQEGGVLQIGEETFQVDEVIELLPPLGEFQYLHVTCSIQDKQS